MPPISQAKESSSMSNLRLRGRQSASSKEGQSSSTKKRGRPSYKDKSVATRWSASSIEGQSSSKKKRGRPQCKDKLVATGQPASSNEGHATTAKSTTKKRRHVFKSEEIKERMARRGLKEKEDFSTAIVQIVKDLFSDLEISEEAIADMNTYINHIFERVASFASSFLLARSSVQIAVKDIDVSITFAIPGDLGQHCKLQGRRAVKKCHEVDSFEEEME